MGRWGKQVEPLYRACRQNIYALCDAMHFKPTWQQELVFDAVNVLAWGDKAEVRNKRVPRPGRHRRIAVKSGQGPGKTRSSVVVALFRCLFNVDALTVVTAPTKRQTVDIWLAEAKRALEPADPWLRRMIEITKSRIIIAGRDEWGVKLMTATKQDNAAGWHQENLTIIVEEASGVARPIIETFKGTLTNPNNLLLQIGNPTLRDSHFFDSFNMHRGEWYCQTFDAEETARDYPWIVDPARNRALENEYGRDSDVYRVRVLGQFPNSDPNCVMSSEECEAGSRTDPYSCGTASDKRQFGIDYARLGSDESTIFQRKGNAIVDWKAFAKKEPVQVTRHAFRMQAEWGWQNDRTWFVPDADGMGQGVMGLFYDPEETSEQILGKLRTRQVIEFHNNGTSGKQDYANKITEAYFEFAKRLRRRELHIPNDPRLIKQLSTRQYHINKQGKIALEPKDVYCARGFESPDRADACVMAFYDQASAPAQIATKEAPRSIAARVRA